MNISLRISLLLENAIDLIRRNVNISLRISMLFEIIEPFEEARKSDYNREMFDFYDHLHDGHLFRPGRS